MTFTMSFWLLVVIFTRLANFLVVENRQTRPRRFWVHDVLRRRDGLCEYARPVQELPLDSARSNGYFLMSPEQLVCVRRLVGPHISRLPTVYVAVHVQGETHDVVRGRTQYERRLTPTLATRSTRVGTTSWSVRCVSASQSSD